MNINGLHIVFILCTICGCKPSSKDLVDISNKNLNLINGELFYNNILFEGELVAYYDSKNIKSKIEYVDGKKHGLENQWYKNGDKLLERFYAKGFKIGIHKSWWENGNLKFEYHFNNKGEYHGVVKEWYLSGQPYRSFNYVNGKEEGNQRLWKHDGSIQANYEVVHGERFGLIGLKKCYTVTVNKDEVK